MANAADACEQLTAAERLEFLVRLEYASEVVAGWPEWKRNLLGRSPVMIDWKQTPSIEDLIAGKVPWWNKPESDYDTQLRRQNEAMRELVCDMAGKDIGELVSKLAGELYIAINVARIEKGRGDNLKKQLDELKATIAEAGK